MLVASLSTPPRACPEPAVAPDQSRTLPLPFVNGKLLAEGEVLKDHRLMTFSEEPNQSK